MNRERGIVEGYRPTFNREFGTNCLKWTSEARFRCRDELPASGSLEHMRQTANGGKLIVLTAPLTETIDHAGFFIQMGVACSVWVR